MDEREFVVTLEGYVRREDRAALAALRRGFGKPAWEAPEMYRYVVPLLGPGISDDRAATFIATASAFAYHPCIGTEGDPPSGRRNIGKALREIAQRDPESRPAIERRFEVVLRADRADLVDHLWRIVTLLKSKEIDVDWRQFLHDVGYPSWSQVRREWAAAFWAPPPDGAGPSRGREEAPTVSDRSEDESRSD